MWTVHFPLCHILVLYHNRLIGDANEISPAKEDIKTDFLSSNFKANAQIIIKVKGIVSHDSYSQSFKKLKTYFEKIFER